MTRTSHTTRPARAPAYYLGQTVHWWSAVAGTRRRRPGGTASPLWRPVTKETR